MHWLAVLSQTFKYLSSLLKMTFGNRVYLLYWLVALNFVLSKGKALNVRLVCRCSINGTKRSNSHCYVLFILFIKHDLIVLTYKIGLYLRRPGRRCTCLRAFWGQRVFILEKFFGAVTVGLVVGRTINRFDADSVYKL